MTTSFDYTGTVVAITGASSGIGLEIAKAFYASGASLALCSRSADRVREAVKSFVAPDDARVFITSCDSSVVSNIRAFRDAAVQRFGRIDVWVNNAGIEHPCPTVDVSEEIFDSVVHTNFRGYYFGCQAAAQDMLKRRSGVIINIGSVIGEGTMIDMGAVLGGRATVGKRCHIGAGTVLAGVVEPASATPVVVEDDVLIGANAVVLEGVRVGRGAVVAAGAVCVEDVPAGAVVAGVPARVIKQADEVAAGKVSLVDALRNL